MVRALFAVAGCMQPAVIFVDEIDSILSARKSEGACPCCACNACCMSTLFVWLDKVICPHAHDSCHLKALDSCALCFCEAYARHCDFSVYPLSMYSFKQTSGVCQVSV